MPLNFQQLRDASRLRGIEWMGKPNDESDALFCAVELGGECGEVLNAVKKLERFRRGVPGGTESTENLAEELADVVICVDRVAEAFGVDLSIAIPAKFNKTSLKYGLETQLNSC